MTNKHTPKPWLISSNTIREAGTKRVVATVHLEYAREEQINADVRLIAAAPDLLHALQMIFKEPYGCTLCDSGVSRNAVKGHQPDCPFELARLAAEKATGETCI